jgi:hypothetical protein
MKVILVPETFHLGTSTRDGISWLLVFVGLGLCVVYSAVNTYKNWGEGVEAKHLTIYMLLQMIGELIMKGWSLYAFSWILKARK